MVTQGRALARCNCGLMVTQCSLVRSKSNMKVTHDKTKKRTICSTLVTKGRAKEKGSSTMQDIVGRGVGPKAFTDTTRGK